MPCLLNIFILFVLLSESDSDDALPLSSDDDDEPEADKKNAKGNIFNLLSWTVRKIRNIAKYDNHKLLGLCSLDRMVIDTTQLDLLKSFFLNQ